MNNLNERAIITNLLVAVVAGIGGGIGLASLIMAMQTPKEVTHTERRSMEVVRVDLRPKTNSTIDLKVIGVPTVYRDQHVWCSRHEAERIQVGSHWDVVVQNYKRGDRYGTELVGLEAICERSQ